MGGFSETMPEGVVVEETEDGEEVYNLARSSGDVETRGVRCWRVS